ncbi:MAG: hypothetical protein Q9168_001885 [Polycauliona sp. 1 TL-2023]
MPSQVLPDQLCTAILDSVQHGLYPDSEDIISASFPPSVLSNVLNLFDDARDKVKVLRPDYKCSTAQDIDGWISQAKQLRNDIDRVQSSSRDILSKAQKNRELRRDVHDASSKLDLLEEELAFNKALAATVELVRHVRRAILRIQDLSNQGELSDAIEIMLENQKELGQVGKGRRIKAFEVLATITEDLRQDIIAALNRRWHDLIHIDAQKATVSLPQDTQPLHTVSCAMESLGLLHEHIVDLTGQLELAILLPRLRLQNGTHERLLVAGEKTLAISETASASDMHRLIDDLGTFIAFLTTNLPLSVVVPLSQILTPVLVERLVSLRLSVAIPADFIALQSFDSTRDEIERFSESLRSHGWPGQDQLHDWIDGIPQLWVQQRQISSLDCIRQLLHRGYGEIKTVERVETQVISQQDRIFTADAGNDSWDAGWSDEDVGSSPDGKANLQKTPGDQEEEDVNAWRLNDEADEHTKLEGAAPPTESDDENDAWGWGDAGDTIEASKSPQGGPSPSHRAMNGHDRHKGQRQVTLKESYNTTALPAGILDLIKNVIHDLDEFDKQ